MKDQEVTSREYCSVFSSYEPSQFSNSKRSTPRSYAKENVIILGAAFMKDYYMIFDGELSRIGMAQKRSQYCRTSPDSQTLTTLNENETLRLVMGTLYLFLALTLASKVSILICWKRKPATLQNDQNTDRHHEEEEDDEDEVEDHII